MALSNSNRLTKTLNPLLCPAAIALFVILAMANTVQSQTVNFNYDFYGGPKPTTLTYQGDAHFPSDSTYLRLTKTNNSGNAVQSSAGRVLYSDSIPFWEAGAQADFESTIKFKVRPNPNDNDPADGIAFFITTPGSTIPSGGGGGSFGIFGPSGRTSSLFAVEFDIYVNGWDPRSRHVGIDIESRISASTTTFPDTFLGEEVTLVINYVGATRVIRVVATANGQRYEVSYVFDLTTILPQQVQFGIAASTGQNVAVHDVISWYLTSTLVHNGNGRKEGAFIRQLV